MLILSLVALKDIGWPQEPQSPLAEAFGVEVVSVTEIF